MERLMSSVGLGAFITVSPTDTVTDSDMHLFVWLPIKGIYCNQSCAFAAFNHPIAHVACRACLFAHGPPPKHTQWILTAGHSNVCMRSWKKSMLAW